MENHGFSRGIILAVIVVLFFGCSSKTYHISHTTIPDGEPLPIDGLWDDGYLKIEKGKAYGQKKGGDKYPAGRLIAKNIIRGYRPGIYMSENPRSAGYWKKVVFEPGLIRLNADRPTLIIKTFASKANRRYATSYGATYTGDLSTYKFFSASNPEAFNEEVTALKNWETAFNASWAKLEVGMSRQQVEKLFGISLEDFNAGSNFKVSMGAKAPGSDKRTKRVESWRRYKNLDFHIEFVNDQLATWERLWE